MPTFYCRDRKRKKFINLAGTMKKRVKTENGTWIDATYKSDRYKEWMDNTKSTPLRVGDEETGASMKDRKRFGKGGRRWHTKDHKAEAEVRSASPVDFCG